MQAGPFLKHQGLRLRQDADIRVHPQTSPAGAASSVLAKKADTHREEEATSTTVRGKEKTV